ncbi:MULTISPECIES: SpoIID/LytB domain-containing protein [unclassified Modestobacter]
MTTDHAHTAPTGRSRLRRWGAAALVGVGLMGGASLVAPATASAELTGDVVITGHGWGHGRGMGQYGAYGYATNHGWSYQQIVGHFYGGTTLGGQANGPITVALTARDNQDLLVTSGRDFVVGGVAVGAGSAARVQARPDGSYLLTTSYGCDQPGVWQTVVPNSRVVSTVDPGNDLHAMLSLCTAAGLKQYRGELSVVWANNAQRTVNTLAMEDYLRGVVPRESPASWGDGGGGKGMEALKAQAVAARSYAWSENRWSWAKTCETTSCQVYLGAGSNHASLEDRRTDSAIAATAGVVLRNAKGAIQRTEFSSSTGGWSAGGTFPAVVDDGDAISPHHNWSQTVPATTIGNAFGVGTLIDIKVTARNGLGADGGRVTKVDVVGTAKTVSVTGANVRVQLGLKSDWFVIQGAGAAPAPQPPQVPVNPDLPTIYRGSGNAGAPSASGINFGDPGDVPLACDWNGDGLDTSGVFRNGLFLLSNGEGGSADVVFGFGQGGDQPFCGDWDGDGKETVGVYRAGQVFLRNSLTTGIADGQYWFGATGDTVVAGDWNGDGYDTPGVWRSGVFYLTNSNLRPTTDVVLPYGDVRDLPAVGDWDGNGTDTVGVFRNGTFLLRNALNPGLAEATVPFGDVGDRPLVAAWKARGPSTVGVSRKY